MVGNPRTIQSGVLGRGVSACRQVTTTAAYCKSFSSHLINALAEQVHFTGATLKKPVIARILASEGNCYLELQKSNEAIAAYSKTAEMDPNPGVAYFNLCATMYNTGDIDDALPGCGKAIAADPGKADAYFIKGSLLIAGSTTDKNGKLQAPPGTVVALKKYLELAPDGPHVKDVKDMLAYLGDKAETSPGIQRK